MAGFLHGELRQIMETFAYKCVAMVVDFLNLVLNAKLL